MPRTHNVVYGDKIKKLAAKYYGVEAKAYLIINANPQLTGRPISLESLPTIYPGDTLIIPEDVSDLPQAPETIKTDDDKKITIITNGKQFSFFTEYTLTQHMDTFDSFELQGPYEKDLEVYRESFRPLSFNKCALYYGNEIVFNGIMIAPVPESTESSNIISLTGYPLCGVLNDCPMPISSYPVEFKNQKLDKIAKTMLAPFGVGLNYKVSAGNVFEKVAPEPDENVYSFLAKLAEQRGTLLTNDVQGNLMAWKADTTSAPVATIRVGDNNFLGCHPNFDPQNYFSHITGISPTTESKKSDRYTVKNKWLINRGILRPYTYTEKDSKDLDLRTAVNAKAGRMFASSAPYELSLRGHRDPNGNRWKVNTSIVVYDPGSAIYRETKFLIKDLVATRSSDAGDRTTLSLVLPSAYNGEIPEEVPWEE